MTIKIHTYLLLILLVACTNTPTEIYKDRNFVKVLREHLVEKQITNVEQIKIEIDQGKDKYVYVTTDPKMIVNIISDLEIYESKSWCTCEEAEEIFCYPERMNKIMLWGYLPENSKNSYEWKYLFCEKNQGNLKEITANIAFFDSVSVQKSDDFIYETLKDNR